VVFCIYDLRMVQMTEIVSVATGPVKYLISVFSEEIVIRSKILNIYGGEDSYCGPQGYVTGGHCCF